MKQKIIKQLDERLNNSIDWKVEDDTLYIVGTTGKESITYESDLSLNFNLALNIGLSKVDNLIQMNTLMRC